MGVGRREQGGPHGVWNFWLRLRSCFGWIHFDSAPTHFKVLDSDSCSNSKVNYLNFWQCLNERIGFCIKKTKQPYQMYLRITAIRGGARGCQGGHFPPQILPGLPSAPPKIRSLSVGLFLKVLHRPSTAPLVAKLAPPVAPPNENVWLRPWLQYMSVASQIKN